MDIEKPIFCLEHCHSKKMFSFKIPNECMFCNSDLSDCELRIPPFRLPSPFHSAKEAPCSVVLKPTRGDFLTDYKNSDQLHIGITDGQGVVHEFDVDGLKTDKTNQWQRCLVIRGFNKGKNLTSWAQYWDFTLQVVSGQDKWHKERYNETTNNCYSFVLAFLRALQTPDLSSYARDRRVFCEKYILPKTATAAKYISVYRRLMNDDTTSFNALSLAKK